MSLKCIFSDSKDYTVGKTYDFKHDYEGIFLHDNDDLEESFYTVEESGDGFVAYNMAGFPLSGVLAIFEKA